MKIAMLVLHADLFQTTRKDRVARHRVQPAFAGGQVIALAEHFPRLLLLIAVGLQPLK